ncbi:MAG: hypothetical protein RL885_08085 [Planctomycetota bacterium]
MRITCPQCRLEIPAEDVHLDTSLAKCRRCDSVFDFTEQVPRSERRRDAARRDSARPRENIAAPKGIELRDDGWGGLSIERRWLSPLTFFLLVFVIFWDGFLIFWYSMAGKFAGGEEGGMFSMLFFLFPLIHVAVGLALTYFVVASFFNRTTLQCRDGRLTVTHGPFPWPGKRDLDASDIAQLYTKERIRRGNNGGVHTSYQLRLRTKGGQDVKLLSSLNEPDQAMYIEQEIEKHLGIEDRSVRGEYR